MKNSSTIKSSIILVALAATVFFIGSSSTLVQLIYANYFYPFSSVVQRFISSLFPFAIGDFLYLGLIVFLLYKFVNFLKLFFSNTPINWLNTSLKTLNIGLILYLVFKLSWGLNYNRPNVEKNLNISSKRYSFSNLLELGNYYVHKTNALKMALIENKQNTNYDFSTLKTKAVEAYNKQAQKSTLFTYQIPSIKKVTNGYAISKLGIAGYYNPISGEANINMELPDFNIPYVICHEMAHQVGIAYEDEANLFGYLTANGSDDLFFQYSANYEMMRYILLEIGIKKVEEYNILKEKIHPEVMKDLSKEKEFWRLYNGKMFNYMDTTFDGFLKLNDQKTGINSYQNIVLWLWNLYKVEQNNLPPQP